MTNPGYKTLKEIAAEKAAELEAKGIDITPHNDDTAAYHQALADYQKAKMRYVREKGKKN